MAPQKYIRIENYCYQSQGLLQKDIKVEDLLKRGFKVKDYCTIQ